MMATIMVAVGCLCLVAHTALDLNDLKPTVSPKAARLEPPEHGRVDSACHVAAGLVMLPSEGRLPEAAVFLGNPKEVEINLRI